MYFRSVTSRDAGVHQEIMHRTSFGWLKTKKKFLKWFIDSEEVSGDKDKDAKSGIGRQEKIMYVTVRLRVVDLAQKRKE